MRRYRGRQGEGKNNLNSLFQRLMPTARCSNPLWHFFPWELIFYNSSFRTQVGSRSNITSSLLLPYLIQHFFFFFCVVFSGDWLPLPGPGAWGLQGLGPASWNSPALITPLLLATSSPSSTQKLVTLDTSHVATRMSLTSRILMARPVCMFMSKVSECLLLWDWKVLLSFVDV